MMIIIITAITIVVITYYIVSILYPAQFTTSSINVSLSAIIIINEKLIS